MEIHLNSKYWANEISLHNDITRLLNSALALLPRGTTAYRLYIGIIIPRAARMTDWPTDKQLLTSHWKHLTLPIELSDPMPPTALITLADRVEYLTGIVQMRCIALSLHTYMYV